MPSIRILNPVPKGSAFVSQGRAERYVNAGRATWASSTTIRFDSSHNLYQSAVSEARESVQGYDRRGSMTLTELRNIPIVNPQKMRR